MPSLFRLSLLLLVVTLVVGVVKKRRQPALSTTNEVTSTKNEAMADLAIDQWPLPLDTKTAACDSLGSLFIPSPKQAPIVKTIHYTPYVPWIKGRAAWIADYAAHYETSKHFIARSLSRNRPLYSRSEIAEGDRFNVLRRDKPFAFHLLVDLSRCQAWFLYRDTQTKKESLLKSYAVCVGRLDASAVSGSLTPIGTYKLGHRVGIYRVGTKGDFRGERIEMVRVFGTRWVPFLEEVCDCSEPAKGYGIHGMPWEGTPPKESTDPLRAYSSDGCIRFRQADIEEIFAIILARDATIEIVRHLPKERLQALQQLC